MALRTEQCRAEDCAEIIRALDLEFVSGKGRTLSVATRYPHVFGGSLSTVRILRDGERWVACTAVRLFTYSTGAGSELLRGAMIGFVYTRPEMRGRGAASVLLTAIVDELRDTGCDFGVLWTGIPEFYRTLGWVPADRSVLGKWRREGQAVAGLEPLRRLEARHGMSLEAIRETRSDPRVLRAETDYAAVPIPATRVDVAVINGPDGNPHGYALVGVHGNIGYVYEMCGTAEDLPVIWRFIAPRFDQVYFNDAEGSGSFKFLSAVPGVSWNSQALAMWLPISEGVDSGLVDRVHIPWFDRI